MFPPVASYALCRNTFKLWLILFIVITDRLHTFLRPPLLPLSNNAAITHSQPRCSLCNPRPHPLRQRISRHMLRSYHLHPLDTRPSRSLVTPTPTRMVPNLSAQHSKGLAPHRTSLCWSTVRKSHRRLRLARMDQRPRDT